MLEGHAAAGLADVVASAVDEAGTALGNLISASGLDLAGKAALTAADWSALTAAKSIATGNAISVAAAKLLGRDAAPRSAPSPRAARGPRDNPMKRPGCGWGAISIGHC